jgi:hypothetical protein
MIAKIILVYEVFLAGNPLQLPECNYLHLVQYSDHLSLSDVLIIMLIQFQARCSCHQFTIIYSFA